MDSPENNMNTSIRSTDANITGNKELYTEVYHVLYGYVLPSICVLGFLGNVMNLIILAGKRVQRSLKNMEQAANIGLIALAVADMMFCLIVFPSTFLPEDGTFKERGFLVYYGCYCTAVINIFIMASTWLTVTMATERYLAICHPLRSRNIITLRGTKIVIILVYVFSTLWNIPVFWRYVIEENSINNLTIYNTIQQPLFQNNHFDHVYRAGWAVLGNFIPLIMLIFSNVCLTREVHKSYAMRRNMDHDSRIHKHHSTSARDAETSNRITITLVSIVLMFLVLVAPSELLKHVAFLLGSDLSSNYTYLTIEIITNIMQTINFSANFILYCIINPSFRRTMKEYFCFHYKKLSTTDPTEFSFREVRHSDAGCTMLAHQGSAKSAKCNCSFRANGNNVVGHADTSSMPVRSLR